MKTPTITIKKIAELANVSTMTVSRVINNEKAVKAETREKVLKYINKHNYRPNPRARAFVLKRSKLIGLVVADIRNMFFCELARGIEDTAYERGYSVAICSTDDKPERTKTYIEHMIAAGVDGIIYGSSHLQEPAIEKLIDERFPLILVARKMKREDCNYVVLDNVRAARGITAHLIGLNYRKIAIITGQSYISTGIDRFNGYKDALKESGIPFSQHYVVQGPFTRDTGYEGTRRLLSLEDPPRAIFAGNDYIAMGAIDAIQEKGLRVPHDIALVGFDDTTFASNKRIQLTTVDHRQYQMGNLASQILIEYIERNETDYTHRIVLEPRIILRESCGRNLKERKRHEND